LLNARSTRERNDVERKALLRCPEYTVFLVGLNSPWLSSLNKFQKIRECKCARVFFISTDLRIGLSLYRSGYFGCFPEKEAGGFVERLNAEGSVDKRRYEP
jgi:hypothetical protein